ncbi:MAG: HD domain-containing protein [Parasporobacterium sp.]|nr:HD domain-containing protein [Parasporobacterium sp.]
MNLDRTKVTEAFREYTAAYNAQDPKIRLKILHTYRVASLCEQITRELPDGPVVWEKSNTQITRELPEKPPVSDNPEKPQSGNEPGAPIDPDLAWLSGMLHDIGRFEQVRIYHTFVDAESVDHAQFGADLLFQKDLLRHFVPAYEQTMTASEREILELAIRNHGVYRIQEGLTAREAAYCNILRDADKIDIFRVNWDTPLEEIYNTTTRALKEARVTQEVRQCFLDHTAVPRYLKKTPIDHLVGHLCLIFELVYPVSRRIAREQGYVDKLLTFQSDLPETQEWFAYMKEHLWKEMQAGGQTG